MLNSGVGTPFGDLRIIQISIAAVRAADARLLATGRTDQVFTDLEGKLALTRPPVYEAFLARWDGALSTPTP